MTAPVVSVWVMREAVVMATGAGMAEVQDLSPDDLEYLWQEVWASNRPLALEAAKKVAS